MRPVPQVIKFRNRRRTTEISNPTRKIGLSLSLLASLVAAVCSLVLFYFYYSVTQDLPPVEVLPSLLEPPDGALLQPTRLFDRTGEQVILTLENPAASGRQYLVLGENSIPGADQFSEHLIEATIATFDPGFWKHDGYSTEGLSSGTHPTIAQRLVLDLLIGDEPSSIRRNIRERILAEQVTAKFGRQKILEWYLNSAQYGESLYGADAAARVYFSKSASKLSLGEAAALTAISEIPGINPLIVPQWIKQQQEGVLQVMLDNGVISEREATTAMEEELKYRTGVEMITNASNFTELVLKQLDTVLSLDRVRRGGFKIITTLDGDLQHQAECTTRIYLAQLQAMTEPAGEVNADTCAAALLLSPIQPSEAGQTLGVNAEVVILDPQTGQILAQVNQGAEGEASELLSRHTAGTILSPFIYITAFSHGMSPANLLWDVPKEPVPGDSNPTPVDTPVYHGPVRARKAMVNDFWAATEGVFNQIEAENVIQTEMNFGISVPSAELIEDLTLNDLYKQENSLLELVSAYAVLANQGIMAGQAEHLDAKMSDERELTPSRVLRVIGPDGKVWLDWSDPQQRSIISPQLTYLVTHTLSDASARLPDYENPDLLAIGRPVAAKAGVSMEGSDAWMIGYTPELAAGVWSGYSRQETGDNFKEIPAALWQALVKYAAEQIPASDFKMPPGVSLIQVCDPSGLLVSPTCTSVVQEVFLQGNEPTQVDNLFQILQINRDTGLLATAFTPFNLVEDRKYLIFPPQADAWAKMESIPIPPVIYDSTSAVYSDSQDVQLTNPAMFDPLRGQVAITGIAAGPDFSFYRLQVGKGLNPHQWIQIGKDELNPVEGGLLGTWDTQGMEGIYILQLQVVRQDQRIQRAMVQVMIDNETPEIHILDPEEGERVALGEGESLMVQVSVSDAQGLERVDFYLDNQLESTLIQPPFIIFWNGHAGGHTLDVKAYDLAGNTGEAAVSFTIEVQN